MSWHELLGQERVVQGLRNAMRKKRLPHGFLFIGPDGVGKRTAARLFARALLCETADGDICNVCGPCIRTARGSHPDFHELAVRETDQQIKREAFEEFIARIYLKSFEGDCKVFIIPHADRFNDTTSNLFLKTLEEPPAGTVIIMTVPDEHLLLDTIVSRSQRVRFGLLPQSLIEKELLRRDVSSTVATAAAASCGGSLGRALVIQHADTAALVAFVWNVLLSPGPHDTGRLSVALAEQINAGAERAAGKGNAARQFAFRQILDFSAMALRDVLTHGNANCTPYYNDFTRESGKLAASVSQQGILHALEAIQYTSRALKTNARIETAASVLAGTLVELFADV